MHKMATKYKNILRYHFFFVPLHLQRLIIMLLSIITINRNDAEGLKKTLESVMKQEGVADLQIEHVIVDGASTDESVEVIRQATGDRLQATGGEGVYANGICYRWISEPDKGIYNAMNKGIRMASGEYIQILNSADVLAAPDVCVRMLAALEENNYPGILYGNMIRAGQKHGRDVCFGANHIWTMDDFIRGTINHDPTYISAKLYEKYGLYDESLKICSDWKWFVTAVVFGGEKPVYVPIDVTIFDTSGISETNLTFREEERRRELEKFLPAAILKDYDDYHFLHTQYKRLKKHHLYPLVYFMERVLFKLEKWHVLR